MNAHEWKCVKNVEEKNEVTLYKCKRCVMDIKSFNLVRFDNNSFCNYSTNSVENKSNFLIHIFALYLNWRIIGNIIQYIFGIFFEKNFQFINYIIYLMLLCGVFVFIAHDNIFGLKYIIIFCFTLLLMCGITMLITPASFIIMPKALFYGICNVLVTIFLFLQVDNIYKFEKALIPYIYLGLIYCIFSWLEFNSNGQYSMSFSYSIMIPALVSLTQFISKRKYRYLIFFLIFAIVNLRIGSRGSFLCFGAAILFIFMIFKGIKKIIFILSALLPAGILVFANLQKIFMWLHDIFPDSRNIELFAEGNFLYLSGREEYYEFIMNHIMKSPLQIRGIFSDRIYLGNYFNRTDVTEIMGSYAHNFFLEVLFQFGIWGLPILIFFIFVVIKSIHIVKITENISLKNLYIVFASYCIGQLMFSSSYLTAISFGCYVGIITLILLKKRTYYSKAFPAIISRDR